MLYILPQIPICPVPCLELIAAWAMTLPVVDVDDEAMSNHQTDGLSVTSCWVIVILLGGLMPNMPISPFTALTMKYSNSAFTSES
jgi:hypothetical protein